MNYSPLRAFQLLVKKKKKLHVKLFFLFLNVSLTLNLWCVSAAALTPFIHVLGSVTVTSVK